MALSIAKFIQYSISWRNMKTKFLRRCENKPNPFTKIDGK